MKTRNKYLLATATVCVGLAFSFKTIGPDPIKLSKNGNFDSVKIKISAEEMSKASDIYFDKCAGCHGSLRKGATGPSLLPNGDAKSPATKTLGMAGLRAFIENGTANGMP